MRLKIRRLLEIRTGTDRHRNSPFIRITVKTVLHRRKGYSEYSCQVNGPSVI